MMHVVCGEELDSYVREVIFFALHILEYGDDIIGQFCVALSVDELEALFELLHRVDFWWLVNVRPWLNSRRLIHGATFNDL